MKRAWGEARGQVGGFREYSRGADGTVFVGKIAFGTRLLGRFGGSRASCASWRDIVMSLFY